MVHLFRGYATVVLINHQNSDCLFRYWVYHRHQKKKGSRLVKKVNSSIRAVLV